MYKKGFDHKIFSHWKALNHAYLDSDEYEEIEEKSLAEEEFVEEYILPENSNDESIQNESWLSISKSQF